MSYKIGLVSVSFRSHSPTQILAAMNDAGLSFIEWGSDVHCPKEKAEEIAALQTRYGITCCSYGTYFRLGISSMEELPAYIAAAKILGTDILRLWCGNKNSEEYTEAEKEHLFRKCREAAILAERNGVILCVECHNKTYTNKKEAALELMQAVNSPAFRMYWQPNQRRTVEENVAYARPGCECLYNVRMMEETGHVLALGAGGISKRIWPAGGKITRAPNVGNIEEYIARTKEMCERKKALWEKA